MASSTNSYKCFVPTLPFILLAVFAIAMTTAAPVQRSAPSMDLADLQAVRYLMEGVVFIEGAIRNSSITQANSEPQSPPAMSLACTVYDIYVHISLLESQLCKCDPNYSKVAATKYIAEKVMKAACNFTYSTSDSSDTTPKCSVKAIGDACLEAKLTSQLSAYLDQLLQLSGGGVRIDTEHWIAESTRPEFGEPEESIYQALQDFPRL